MSLSTRNQAQIERRLVKSLTEACEKAKGQINGFVWLTHVVDYTAFPASLKIVWVFDTQVSRRHPQMEAHEAARKNGRRATRDGSS